jgi:hypothetical protein
MTDAERVLNVSKTSVFDIKKGIKKDPSPGYGDGRKKGSIPDVAGVGCERSAWV